MARQHQTEKGQAIYGHKSYTILGALYQWPGTSPANAAWLSWISSFAYGLAQITLESGVTNANYSAAECCN